MICPTCHVDYTAEQYGKSYYCKGCMADRARKYRVTHPAQKRDEWRKVSKEKRAAQFKRWRKNNLEYCRQKRRENYLKNKDRELARAREYKLKNKERLSAQQATRLKNNPETNRFYRSLRRAAEKRATPSWANKKIIRSIYLEAARLTILTGIEHHVDHIVPLQSQWVCGLHVEANLQILPSYANQSKSNRYWPDMPDLTGCSPQAMAA